MMTEAEYSKKTDISHRKRFGQFFTPEPIADFMTKWVLEGLDRSPEILEPAFGLGIFTRHILKNDTTASITGFEIDKTIFDYAESNFAYGNNQLKLINHDYISFPSRKKYNGIICNPPYLKFHDYDNGKLISEVNANLRLNLTGFTNIYTLFLLKSVFQLKKSGRLAFIIPSEFLNSDYGVEVKRALLASGTLRHIIIIDYTQCAFENALTTACILLCENSGPENRIRFSKIKNPSNLNSTLSDYRSIDSELLDPKAKWRQYYDSDITAPEFKNLVPFSTFAKVSRGIATGSNSYFTFNTSKKDFHHIPEKALLPCICHSVDIKTPVLTKELFDNLSQSDKLVYLFKGVGMETNPFVRKYIESGEVNGDDKKHLTSKRTPWYSLENRRPSPIWVSVFNRKGLRFVRNEALIHNLTTFHCVYNNDTVETDILFAYLITDMAKEIFLDNCRQYGNGLIKFEPNDLNRGYVADLRLLSEKEKEFIVKIIQKIYRDNSLDGDNVERLDRFFRAKYTERAIGHNELQQ